MDFQAGDLSAASGRRAIFSDRSFISRQRWADNIFNSIKFPAYRKVGQMDGSGLFVIVVSPALGYGDVFFADPVNKPVASRGIPPMRLRQM